jgi:hypothetical protein
MTEDRVTQLKHQLQIAQRRAEEAETRAAQAERSYEKSQIEIHIREAAAACGVKEGAIPDVVARALRTGEWKLDSQGKLLRQKDGLPDVDTKGDYITPKNWVKSLRSDAPFYFQDGQEVVDAQVAKPGHLHTGVNPWLPEHWNMTKQARICAVSMIEAAHLAEEAGTKVGATRPTPKKGA